MVEWKNRRHTENEREHECRNQSGHLANRSDSHNDLVQIKLIPRQSGIVILVVVILLTTVVVIIVLFNSLVLVVMVVMVMVARLDELLDRLLDTLQKGLCGRVHWSNTSKNIIIVALTPSSFKTISSILTAVTTTVLAPSGLYDPTNKSTALPPLG